MCLILPFWEQRKVPDLLASQPEPDGMDVGTPVAARRRNPRYKTSLCQNFLASSYCPYGKKCQFAHGESELRERQPSPQLAPAQLAPGLPLPTPGYDIAYMPLAYAASATVQSRSPPPPLPLPPPLAGHLHADSALAMPTPASAGSPDQPRAPQPVPLPPQPPLPPSTHWHPLFFFMAPPPASAAVAPPDDIRMPAHSDDSPSPAWLGDFAPLGAQSAFMPPARLPFEQHHQQLPRYASLLSPAPSDQCTPQATLAGTPVRPPSLEHDCLGTLEQLRGTLERLRRLSIHDHRTQPSSLDLSSCFGPNASGPLGSSATGLAAEGSNPYSLFATEPISGDHGRVGMAAMGESHLPPAASRSIWAI